MATKAICYLPQVDLKSPQKCTPTVDCDSGYPGVKTFYRSVDFTISGNIIYSCKSTTFAYTYWSVRYFNVTLQKWTNYSAVLRSKYASDADYNAVYNDFNLRSINFAKKSLPYGLFEVCANVSMYAEEGKV